MEGRCRNCDRIIFDVKDPSTLPKTLECQHCHVVNEIKKAYASKVPGCGAVFEKPIQLAGHVRREHKEK